MSIVHYFNGKDDEFSWEGVPVREYGDEFAGVTKRIFIGLDDDSNNFIMRYFHLEPGKHSNLERHPHEHGVLILHGKARVQINDDFFQVKKNDAVFISGGDLHQFMVEGDQPLGFLCVIKANPEHHS